jgi:hypothetical protein
MVSLTDDVTLDCSRSEFLEMSLGAGAMLSHYLYGRTRPQLICANKGKCTLTFRGSGY